MTTARSKQSVTKRTISSLWCSPVLNIWQRTFHKCEEEMLVAIFSRRIKYDGVSVMPVAAMSVSFLSTALLLCPVFFKQGSTQVDSSKALIWSTLTNNGDPVLHRFYGDPQVYVPAAINGSSSRFYLSDFTRGSPQLEFGVLDTLYSTSTLFFYSTMNIFLSSEIIPGTGDQRSYLEVVALSNQITGLSVDWVSDLLYWADALYQRICILDIATFGVWRSVVDANLTSPQDVVVYPLQSYVFWSDLSDTPKIERLDLKTDDRRVLLSSSTLRRPTKLAVDLPSQRLFWLDASAATIGSMNFDGSDVSLWTLSPAFSTVSSFALYQNYIFMGSSKIQMIVHIYDRYQRTYMANITGNGQSVIDMTMWSQERQPIIDSPCSSNSGGCDHFCVTLTSNTRRCLCAMGFFLAPDGTGCITKPMKLGKFLLMSDERQKNVFQIDVDTGEVRALTINRGYYLTAMTFDPLCNCLYYFDRKNKVVKKTAFDNSYTQNLFYANGMEIISLAVDSANRILFYVDQTSNTISMFQLSTFIRTLFLSEQGAQPTAIVLDSINGFLYWSDCGRQTIERSSMTSANSNRMSVVIGLISCVNAFAIDSQNGVIFWGDSGGSIATARLDGNSRSVIYRDQNAAYTGLTLDPRFLYIADSNKRQIQKLDRTSFQITNVTRILFTQPYSILYYTNETVQTVTPSSSSSRSTTTTTTTTTTTATTTITTTTTAAAIATGGGAIASSTTNSAIASTVSPTSGVSLSNISPLNTGEGGIGANVIILASVISGAAVLIAVLIAIAVIAYRKCRSRPSNSDPVNIAQPSIYYEVEHNTIHPPPTTPRKPIYDVVSYASPAYESLYSHTPPSYYAELNNPAYEPEDGAEQ